MIKLLAQILKDEQGSTLAVTYAFSPNTLIVSNEVNVNFDDCEAIVNSLTEDNYADDSVTAVKLNSDVVRSNYGLKQHTDGTLYVDVADTNPCLEISDGGVRVKVDGTTITRGASGLVASSVSDHGGLTGLTDDDHTAYLTAARHDSDDHSAFNFASMGTGILPKTKGGTGLNTAATIPRIKVGTYTGNGSATQAVTGIGFQPTALHIMPQTTGVANYWKTSQDGTSAFQNPSGGTGNVYTTSLIVSLDADGFTVGNAGGGGHPNTSAQVYTYVAFG